MPNDEKETLERWPSPEAFYRDRDHRTQLEVNELFRYVYQPIEIHLDRDLAGDVSVQRIALVAANLTARWARKIRVVLPEIALAPPLQLFGDATLGARILREMREADPFGDFEVSGNGIDYAETLRLFIGPCTTPHKRESDYTVTASGWVAYGMRGSSVSHGGMELTAASASALAGALGAGDLFKRAIGQPSTEWLGRIRWCTWTHHLGTCAPYCQAPPTPIQADIGNLLIAGVGAIGSAVLYILGLMPVTGRITLLDRDRVETSNLNRSPLFTAMDVIRMRRKIDAGKALLSTMGVECATLMGTWREQSGQLVGEPFDVWVSLTNEDGAWSEVPFQLPPIVLHGTTTSGWGVGFGRHIPRVEDCTACRLPRPHVEFRGPCSEGEIFLDAKEPVRASLPFLSTIAAALIATELLKLPFSSASSLPNAVQTDLRIGLPAIVTALLGPTASCRGCQMAQLPLWLERGGRSRFASMFSLGRLADPGGRIYQ
jgi:hypothetical protein